MNAKAKFNEMTAKLIEKIESGETKQWIKPWKTGLPKNHITGKLFL